MADTAVSKVEGIKAASNQLRGTIGEELSRRYASVLA